MNKSTCTGASPGLAIAISAALAASTSPATAQEILGEVTVTAQKRQQSIQDVGIAITAMTGEQLDQLGLTRSSDIAAVAPGVHLAYQNGGQVRQFTIRGVGQNDFGDHAEPPNAVYIDEGYVPAQQAQVFATFDLERVEILRGPQGTLFGRNATGGLVHYITRKPTQTFDGYVDLTYGAYDQARVEAAVGGPLSSAVSGRLSMMYNRHGDIARNNYPSGAPVNPDPSGPAWFGSPAGASDGTPDFGNDDQWAVRGQALWSGDNASLLFSGFASMQRVNSPLYQAIATTGIVDEQGRHVDSIPAARDASRCEAISSVNGGCIALGGVDGELAGGFPGFAAPEDGLRPVQGGDLFGYRDPNLEDYDTSSDFSADDFNRYATNGATAKLEWDLSHATLAAVSHVVRSERRFALDVDSGPASQLVTMADQRTTSFSQELRLSGESDRMQWVAGAYYLDIDAEHRQGLANSPGGAFTTTLYPCLVVGNAFDPQIGCIPDLPTMEANTLAELETRSMSAFGQVELALADQWSFIVGARAIREEKDFEALFHVYENRDDRRFETDTLIVEAAPPFRESTSDTLWSAKAELDFRPTGDLLIYASVNRGVKAGSYNAPLIDGSPRLADEDFGYDPEVLIAYETGFKYSIGDLARLNASAFYYDYNDYQAFLFKGVAGAIFNADAESHGFEVELLARPTPWLELVLNTAYIDAKVDGIAIAPGVVRDVRPIYTPEWQAFGLARVELPGEFLAGRLALQVDGSYRSDSFDNIRNFQTHLIPSQTIGNARISWRNADGSLEVQGYVTNFADKRIRTSGYDLSTLCGCSEAAFSDPRWWGVKARYSFGR